MKKKPGLLWSTSCIYARFTYQTSQYMQRNKETNSWKMATELFLSAPINWSNITISEYIRFLFFRTNSHKVLLNKIYFHLLFFLNCVKPFTCQNTICKSQIVDHSVLSQPAIDHTVQTIFSSSYSVQNLALKWQTMEK